MKALVLAAVSGLILMAASLSVQAETNKWASYGSVDTTRQYHGHHYPQHRPNYPSRPPQYYPPHPSHPPQWGYPATRPGLTITYQGPTTVYHNEQSYGFVNGDPAVARIESSTHSVVTDWRNIGLPEPPRGMFWSYENGRYVLVPNR